MLLRRLARSLKEQNWMAIAIEFVLLVAGVFLGTQAANWNEARNLQERKAAALMRMHDEARANIDYLRKRLDVLNRGAPARQEGLRRLSANAWEGADRARIAAAFDSLNYAPALSPPRGVYDELISTGMFAELGDPRLRDAISSYYAYAEFVQHQVDYIRGEMVARIGGRTYPGSHAIYDPAAPRQTRIVYDFPAMSADPQVVSALALDNATLSAQLEWTTRTLQAATAMCAELARIDGRACTASVPSPGASP